MSVRFEFYGIARKRAGTDATVVETIRGEMRLGEALAILSARFPALTSECLAGNQFRPGYIGSIDGERIVTDPETSLRDGQSILIMSADAGG